MHIETMRRDICSVYPNETWKHKVECMTDAQVFRIYKDFENRGKFEEAGNKKKRDGVQLKMDLRGMYNGN